MTFDEIKEKVNKGETVYWKNEHYVVIKGKNDFFIKCPAFNSLVGFDESFVKDCFEKK
jgi:hypothetical protein